MDAVAVVEEEEEEEEEEPVALAPSPPILCAMYSSICLSVSASFCCTFGWILDGTRLLLMFGCPSPETTTTVAALLFVRSACSARVASRMDGCNEDAWASSSVSW